jgi:glyoxylase-like metal-dependent hydrolase (beta-lactamase superfamily II)
MEKEAQISFDALYKNFNDRNIEAVSGKEKSARLLQAEAIFPALSEEHKSRALAFQQMLENIKPVEVDHIPKENECLAFCGGIQIIPTPGHTPGHISLYLKETKTFIAADALVAEDGVFNIANPQFAIDLKQAVASVKKLLEYDIEKIVCYHGGIAQQHISEGLHNLINRFQC